MSKIATVNAKDADLGAMGQRYLIAGDAVALRMWHEESPDEGGPMHERDYETIGYVVSGKVELTVEDDTITLATGDSWHMPTGAKRSYRILQSLTALKATSPAARDMNDA